MLVDFFNAKLKFIFPQKVTNKQPYYIDVYRQSLGRLMLIDTVTRARIVSPPAHGPGEPKWVKLLNQGPGPRCDAFVNECTKFKCSPRTGRPSAALDATPGPYCQSSIKRILKMWVGDLFISLSTRQLFRWGFNLLRGFSKSALSAIFLVIAVFNDTCSRSQGRKCFKNEMINWSKNGRTSCINRHNCL